MKKFTLPIAILWLIALPWFNLAQFICGLFWTDPAYSWRLQDISDLGRTDQPAHALLNIAIISVGIFLILGIVVLKEVWRSGLPAMVARSMLCLAGLGFIVAGLFPSDTINAIHGVLGAGLIFLYGNCGLFFAAAAMDRRIFRKLWLAAILLGLLGLASGVLYITQTYLFLGKGAVERLWIYPPLIWALLAAIRLHRRRPR